MQKGVTVYLVKKNTRGDIEKVCLGLKKIRYAKGKWNGFGGKIERGETIKKAAIREVIEESGVEVNEKDLGKMAEIVYNESPDDWIVNIFICTKWKGMPRETEEMKPKWFAVDNIPYEQMWENDNLWLPRILKGERLKGYIIHDKENKVVEHDLLAVKGFKEQ